MRGDVQCPNNTALRIFVGTPDSAAPQLSEQVPPGHQEPEVVVRRGGKQKRLWSWNGLLGRDALEGGHPAPDLGLGRSGQDCRPAAIYFPYWLKGKVKAMEKKTAHPKALA